MEKEHIDVLDVQTVISISVEFVIIKHILRMKYVAFVIKMV